MESIMQKEKRCFICDTTQNLHLHHVMSGTANRTNSEKYGFKVWLCMNHHTGDDGVHRNPNEGWDLFLKQEAQSYFEANYGTRDDFIRVFGKSWL